MFRGLGFLSSAPRLRSAQSACAGAALTVLFPGTPHVPPQSGNMATSMPLAAASVATPAIAASAARPRASAITARQSGHGSSLLIRLSNRRGPAPAAAAADSTAAAEDDAASVAAKYYAAAAADLAAAAATESPTTPSGGTVDGMYSGTVLFHLYPSLADPKPIFSSFLEGALHCCEVGLRPGA